MTRRSRIALGAIPTVARRTKIYALIAKTARRSVAVSFHHRTRHGATTIPRE